MHDIDELLVKENLSLKDAMRKLNETSAGILLVVNEKGQLKRTVTDGDLRRLLLQNRTLTDALSRLPDVKPKVVHEDASETLAMDRMNELEVDHLPEVDVNGKPVYLWRRKDIHSKIFLSPPHMGELENEYVQEAFASNWIAPLGPNVDAFEKEMAEYLGVASAVAVISGTAAIHLALCVLNIKAGDYVLCSDLTFIASANPILYQGAHPVFIDSEPDTWNMSPVALDKAFHEMKKRGLSLPKAVIVVNIYGQSADYDTLCSICDRHNVPIIEDAAESLGATYKHQASGTLGKIGIYSFNGNKILTTSGGGMLVSNDNDLIKKACFLSTQAREATLHYEHRVLGYNYRMSNILAGIGRGQMHVLAKRVQARRRIFQYYKKNLSHISAIQWMPEAEYGYATRWLSVMLLDQDETSLTPEKIINYFSGRNIELRHVWKPMHLQPLFSGCLFYNHEKNQSISENLFKQGVCLPSGSNLTQADQDRIIEILTELFMRS